MFAGFSMTETSLSCSATRSRIAAPDLRVHHLSSAEHDRHFDLVAALEELLGVACLHLQVVRIDLGPHADLAQDGRVLVLAGLAFLLRLLVLELAVVEQPADRRYRCRRDLYEVEVGFTCQLQGLSRGHDTQTLASPVDEQDFTSSDAVVDSEFSGYSRAPLADGK